MSTQQDIYSAGFENRPPMLNKDNYVPWSSRLLRYAKSKPNGKLIYNSIMHGPYPDEKLTEKEVKQIEVNDQAIQIILIGLPEDIYAAVDSCETAQEIWLRVQQKMKGSDIGIQEKKLSCLMNGKVPKQLTTRMEATKFVRDFKSLAKEADESLAKHKALEFEIERLLRAVVSQDIISIVQSNSVVDTSNLQTELDRVDNTAKTRRPQPMSNTKNDRVSFASKSSCIKNKEVEVEEHHRNLLLSKNKKHMSS
ncbi:hypothetical protein Tco_1492138 [Tanacetum coccineum]